MPKWREYFRSSLSSFRESALTFWGGIHYLILSLCCQYSKIGFFAVGKALFLASLALLIFASLSIVQISLALLSLVAKFRSGIGGCDLQECMTLGGN
jgi:hypothetical protein